MPADTPFSNLFELFGKEPATHVNEINQAALARLIKTLTVSLDAHGRCILLRAPRAGYGKTHLLCQVQKTLANSHEFILIQPTDGYKVDAHAVLLDVISKITQQLPASAGLTSLDVLARKVFAIGLEPLVRSGEVPCSDRQAALNSLHNRAVETFDFHHPNAITAHWARDNFDILGPRLVIEISNHLAISPKETAFWVETMYRFAITPTDQPGRSAQFIKEVESSTSPEAMDRLCTFLNLLGNTIRVVLVADELEGLSTNEEAALRLAAFITSLRHGADRIDVIISVNDDIWENAFIPRLSGGLLDRLSETVITLEPLSNEAIEKLLESRKEGSAEKLLSSITKAEHGYARAVLKTAANEWAEIAENIIPEPEENKSLAAPSVLIEQVTASVEFTPKAETQPNKQEARVVAIVPASELLVSDAEPAVASPFTINQIPKSEENAIPEANFDSPFLIAAAVQAGQNAATPPPKWGTNVPDVENTAPINEPISAPPKWGSVTSQAEPAEEEKPQTVSEPILPPQAQQAFIQPAVVPANQQTFSPEAAIYFATAQGLQNIETPPSLPTFAPSITPVAQADDSQAFSSTSHSAYPYGQQVPLTSPVIPAEQAPPPVPAFVAASDPTPAPAPSSQAPPPASMSNTDRVDELLRQFRERYGRS